MTEQAPETDLRPGAVPLVLHVGAPTVVVADDADQEPEPLEPATTEEEQPE